MNGADLIARILHREGVTILPAFPHSDLIDSAAKFDIRPIIVRQERQALHIADGYARMTAGRQLCATTVQYGPGSENAAGAVAQCFGDNVPVLHIPGGYPREMAAVAPNYRAARNQQAITKWCETVPDVARLPRMMHNAIANLRNGRPGPVTLEVPADIFTAQADAALFDQYRSPARSGPVADRAQLQAIADKILRADNPVIIAGQGILYGQATAELLALAECVSLPVISTLNGKSCFPEDHPLALGCAGGSRSDPVNHFLDRADLIIGLGTSFTRSEYITPLPTAAREFIQLTNCEQDLGKDYPIDLGVIGDAKPSLEALHTLLSPHAAKRQQRGAGVIAEIAAEKTKFARAWMPLLTSDETPINPYRVINDLMQVLDRSKAVVTHDAGSPRDQVTAFYQATVPHGYIGWGKTTQLGMGLGLMQGAKLARPDWHAVNIMGDAAIGMVGMDFETGVRNKIGVTTIVLKNSLMGGYSKYHPNAAQKYQIEALGGNYADLARALGGHGERVEAPADLSAALQRALARNDQGIPALIEVITSEESRIPRNLPTTL